MPAEQSGFTKINLHPFLFQYLPGFVLLFLFSIHIQAQRPTYKIDVTLDTATNRISGQMDIAYTNLTNTPLDKIGIHLWANAYSDKNTAFAKQLLDLGAVDFHFASSKDLGGYESLYFSSSDDPFFFEFDPEHKDIGWIRLANSLQPDQVLHLSASFILKIPISFSRMGRTFDTYQFTQWYPHIAVYDQEGWHTMPYLDQGEFYNDFADYEVKVKLPSGYSIASTGMLKEKTIEDGQTTWILTAENVIDFAWFANPHFKVVEKKVEMEKDKSILLSVYIDTMSLAPWENVVVYAERALSFYSDWLGPYPYPHMSIVSAPWSKGGFMEYPMVAQISEVLDEEFLDVVIAHEIGHTWLYGILANDERSDPWMDEGFNTFLENKYAQRYYPGYKEYFLPKEFRSPLSMPDNDVLQHTLQFKKQLQPPAADPRFQSEDQYLFSAYQLPAQGLGMMESMLGDSMLKAMFNQYFHLHKFTHVAPVDLRVSFEQKCECDLSWFFDGWIREAPDVDYRIKKFSPKKKEVTIENKGTSEIPLQLSSSKGGKQLTSDWLDGFRGVKTIHLDQPADHVRLFEASPQVNKTWWRNSFPRLLWPNFSFLPRLGGYEKNQISITPYYAYNVTDGILPGPVLMSDMVPQHHFKWILAPSFGLKSHKIRGYAEGRYISTISKGPFDKLLISGSVNHFGYHTDTDYLFRDSYLRISPVLALRVAFDPQHRDLTQWWKYRYVEIHQRYGQGIDLEDKIFEWFSRRYGVHEISYSIRSDAVLKPYTASGNTQIGKGFVRFNFNYQQHFAGKDKGRGAWVHAFAGYRPVYKNSKPYTYFTLSGLSSSDYISTDYMYDQWLGGRNKDSGIFAHQVFLRDAGFKTLAISGISNKWMLAAGASYALPFKFGHVYMDAGLYDSVITQKTQFSYSGGFAIILLKDVFEVYLPIFESKDIQNSITYEVLHHWFEKISFQLNYKLCNPLDLADRLTLRY